MVCHELFALLFPLLFELFRLSAATSYFGDSYSHVLTVDRYGSAVTIESPGFPRPYLLSVQPITWLLQSGVAPRGGSFQISFSDLHLHPYSKLEIFDGDKLNFEASTSTHLLKRYVHGAADYYDRLPFMTRNSALTIVFIPSFTTFIHANHFEGFKLEARLVHYPPAAWHSRPHTECNWLSYNRDQMTLINTGWSTRYFDCVWIVRPLMGTRSYARLFTQAATANSVDYDFVVHSGITSHAKIIGHLKPSKSKTTNSFTSDSGLYIRFNGSMSEHNVFVLQYYVYKAAIPLADPRLSPYHGVLVRKCPQDPIFNSPCSPDPKLNWMCIAADSACHNPDKSKCHTTNCSSRSPPNHSCFVEGNTYLNLCPDSECVPRNQPCKITQHSKIICADTDPLRCHLSATDPPTDPHYIGRLNSIVACSTSLLLVAIFGVLLVRTRRKRSQRQQAQREDFLRRCSLRNHISRSETVMSSLLSPVIGQLTNSGLPLYSPGTPPPSYSEVMSHPAYVLKTAAENEERENLCSEQLIPVVEETAESMAEIPVNYASLVHQSPYREEIV